MSHYNNYSTMLRSLSKKYYQNYIDFEEYRSQRKVILDNIDQEFNAHISDDLQVDKAEQSSLSMNIFTLFKGNDIDS